MSGNGATHRRVLRLDPRDNALVALTDLRKGETVSFAASEYVLLSDVPAKHKFLTVDLPAGGDVIMYGVLVGRTAEPLPRGGVFSPPPLRPAAADVIMYAVLVGRTAEPLPRGGLLSTRNLRHAAAAFHDRDAVQHWSPPDVSRWRGKTFLGYPRAEGF